MSKSGEYSVPDTSDRPTIPTPYVEREALIAYERELAVLGRTPDMGISMAFAIFGDSDV